MARAAVIGDSLRICGYGLAGAVLLPVADRAGAVRAWRELPDDIAVAVLTGDVAGWLDGELASRPGVLPVVLPGGAPAAAAGQAPETGGARLDAPAVTARPKVVPR